MTDIVTAMYWLHTAFPYLAFLTLLALTLWAGTRIKTRLDNRRWGHTNPDRRKQ